MTTRKISQQTRFTVEHRFYTRCADKMCRTKHKNPYACDTPTQPILDYIVCDKLTSQVLFESYFQQECERQLQSILGALTDAEWQQIMKVGV